MSEPAAPPRPPAVLLVDDEPFIRDVVSRGLSRHGFRVLTAAGGLEAVELYRRQHDAIDLVLLDLVMPGLDGRATLAALEEVDPGVRCCILSGGGGAEVRPAAGGTPRTVRKPFHMAELVRVLGEMLPPHAPGG